MNEMVDGVYDREGQDDQQQGVHHTDRPDEESASLFLNTCLHFKGYKCTGAMTKKVIVLGGAHHKVAYPPPPSCGQIFYLLRIP